MTALFILTAGKFYALKAAQLATEFDITSVSDIVKILIAVLFLVTAYFLKQFADTVRRLVEDQQGLATTVQLVRHEVQTIQITLQKHDAQITQQATEINTLKHKQQRNDSDTS